MQAKWNIHIKRNVPFRDRFASGEQIKVFLKALENHGHKYRTQKQKLKTQTKKTNIPLIEQQNKIVLSEIQPYDNLIIPLKMHAI